MRINVIVDVPIHQKECVTKNEDDSYTIFINPALCYEEQQKAYAHAMWHINHEDFDKEDVQTVEQIAHENCT